MVQSWSDVCRLKEWTHLKQHYAALFFVSWSSTVDKLGGITYTYTTLSSCAQSWCPCIHAKKHNTVEGKKNLIFLVGIMFFNCFLFLFVCFWLMASQKRWGPNAEILSYEISLDFMGINVWIQRKHMQNSEFHLAHISYPIGVVTCLKFPYNLKPWKMWPLCFFKNLI